MNVGTLQGNPSPPRASHLESRILVSMALAAGMCILAGSGCAYFKSRTEIEIRPFADSTVEVTSDARYSVDPFLVVYLRPHIDGPEVARAKEQENEGREMIRAVVDYSLDVVSLGSSKLSTEGRLEAYANIFMTLATVPIERGWPRYSRTREGLEAVAEQATEADNLLDALNVTQPVIDDFVGSAHDVIDEFEVALESAVEEIETRIEEEHRMDLEFMEMSKTIKFEIWNEQTLIRKFLNGEEESLDAVFERRPELRGLIKNDPPTMEDILVLQREMVDQFTIMAEIRSHLRPEIDLYHRKLRELNDARISIQGRTTRAQIAIMAWDRAHSRLAAGITEPAQINVFSIAESSARKLSF